MKKLSLSKRMVRLVLAIESLPQRDCSESFEETVGKVVSGELLLLDAGTGNPLLLSARDKRQLLRIRCEVESSSVRNPTPRHIG